MSVPHDDTRPGDPFLVSDLDEAGWIERYSVADRTLAPAGQELVQYLKDKYGITKVQKHSDVNATGCPGTRFPFKEISPRWHDNGKAHRERRRRLYGGVSAAKSAR